MEWIDFQASKLKYEDCQPEKYFMLLIRDVTAVRGIIKY